MRNQVQSPVLVQDLAKRFNVVSTTISKDLKALGIQPIRVRQPEGRRGRPLHGVSAQDARKAAARRKAVSRAEKTRFEIPERKLKAIIREWFEAKYGRRATRVTLGFEVVGDDIDAVILAGRSL